jgi:hypothetical protein
MKFRSELDVKKIPWPIEHRHLLLLMGSCFTENMGEKLRHQKFQVLENPHGILFNPVSVSEALADYIVRRMYTADDLFYLNEAYHSWKHHSRFSGLSATEALDKINNSIIAAHQFLRQADYLFITLGSAWTYRLTDAAPAAMPGSVAGNNHKAPAAWFHRTLLTTAETTAILENTVQQLAIFNPNLKIIFTISPVRHLREGAIDNNRSKAVLIQAVHEVVAAYSNCYYFPAYELVIDDLRDYRFYAEDLVHPNYAATQYAWEKFTAACTSATTQKLMEEIAQVRLAFNHKPFHAASIQHQRFLQTNLARTRLLQEQHPYLDFKEELTYFGGGK